MTGENGCIHNSQILHTLDLEFIIDHLSQRTCAYEVILRADMVLDIFDPLGLGFESRILGWQFASIEGLCDERMPRYLIYPFHAGREDLGIDFVSEIAGVDLRRCQWVGTLDVDGSSGERVFKTD